jgi:hypothetical protein
MTTRHDFQTATAALQETQTRSMDLPWAKENPWRCSGHIGESGADLLVDLHGLSVPLGCSAVEAIAEVAHLLDCGAVVFVTGSGNHTGGISRLRSAVLHLTEEIATDHNWRAHKEGPARVRLVFNESRVAEEGYGALFWLFALVFGAAVVALGYDWLIH